jgi:Cu+-exporting ATPase
MADATDPVCGMTFPEETAEEMGAFKVVHKGRTHWLCSSTCKETFEKHPDKYA